MREDDDLVLEEVRPLGDLVEVEVLPLLRALPVSFLDEGAFEKQDFRREERPRRAGEDPFPRVARVGDERDPDLPCHSFAPSHGVTDFFGGTSGELGSEPVPDLGRDEREGRDAVVRLESFHLEIAPETDARARLHRNDARVVPHALEPLMELENLRPGGHARRMGVKDAPVKPQEPPLRAPVREPGAVVEVRVREEDVRDCDEL